MNLRRNERNIWSASHSKTFFSSKSNLRLCLRRGRICLLRFLNESIFDFFVCTASQRIAHKSIDTEYSEFSNNYNHLGHKESVSIWSIWNFWKLIFLYKSWPKHIVKTKSYIISKKTGILLCILFISLDLQATKKFVHSFLKSTTQNVKILMLKDINFLFQIRLPS